MKFFCHVQFYFVHSVLLNHVTLNLTLINIDVITTVFLIKYIYYDDIPYTSRIKYANPVVKQIQAKISHCTVLQQSDFLGGWCGRHCTRKSTLLVQKPVLIDIHSSNRTHFRCQGELFDSH